ncbi:MAG: trehalose-6-phosphate synthase [Phycisphaerales bacterium]|nr:trehalose-6-phosphate synthase [Phycisphaerales bacterium]
MTSATTSRAPGDQSDAVAGTSALPRRRSGSAARTTRLLVVANRLPLHRTGTGSDGSWRASAGGLVTALEPILRSTPGAWVGWTGAPDDRTEPFVHDGIEVRPVPLSRVEVEHYYHGMSNRTFWPLYHDAIVSPEFHRTWWGSYLEVNQRFAAEAAAAAAPGDLVWVHDYHLQLVPQLLRARRPDVRIGFFLHIPFPPQELFEWLPWREEILRGLLGADLIGFQTAAAARNFAQLCRHHRLASGSADALEHDGRTVRAQAFPISIDFDWFDTAARKPETLARAEEIRRLVGPERRILLSVDRLDYTKGIDRRIEAFGELLARRLASVEDCVFLQIAAPSREAVHEYKHLRRQIDGIVGSVNGTYSTPGRIAVQYFRRNLTRAEILPYYCAADVMLVTPLRDGMNLVAKEYVACRTNGDGVLVLSEFAGAAQEMRQAIQVNPRDLDRMTESFASALTMDPAEAKRRMSGLRRTVRRRDVHAWSKSFFDVLRGGADGGGGTAEPTGSDIGEDDLTDEAD